MDLKTPLTYSEQVEQLRSHGLIVESDTDAITFLKQVNYYKFTGYTLHLRTSPSSSDLMPGHTFTEVRTLYQFDAELRHLLRGYLETAEVYYKTQISNSFALEKCMDPPHDQHYLESNYHNKSLFERVIRNFTREHDYYVDSLIVKHHDECYGGRMPLWVMTELMSFSSVSTLYNAMYASSQDAIAHNIGVGRKVLSNHLHCMSVLRNKCSHGARLTNTRFHPPVKLPKEFLVANPGIDNASLFAYLYMLSKRLPDAMQRQSFITEFYALMDRYAGAVDPLLLGFPLNYRGVLK